MAGKSIVLENMVRQGCLNQHEVLGEQIISFRLFLFFKFSDLIRSTVSSLKDPRVA
jgi:hypothetical protein